MTPKELRAWRFEHDFTPQAFAEAIGVARNTVYRWEAGSMEVPADLASRLASALASHNVTAPQERKVRYVDNSAFDLSTEQPHGSVIGLRASFWRGRTDADRDAWIEQAANPLLALPWPWWSHGFEWWPPRPLVKGGPSARELPHYMMHHDIAALRERMATLEGSDMERLRRAVAFYCRRDFPYWLRAGKPTGFDPFSYEALQKAMRPASL